MKHLYFTLFLCILISLSTPKKTFGQTNESKSNLTIKEVQLLDSLLINKKSNFSFEGKKAAFISGHSATTIENKDYFFKYHINDVIERGLKPVITYRILEKEEVLQTGGYNVIIMQVPKLLTNKQHNTNLQNLAKLASEE